MAKSKRALVVGEEKRSSFLCELLSKLGYALDRIDYENKIKNIELYSIFFVYFEPFGEFLDSLAEIVKISDKPVFIVTDEPLEGLNKAYIPYGFEILSEPLDIESISLKIREHEKPLKYSLRIALYEPERYWAELFVGFLKEEKHIPVVFETGAKFIKEGVKNELDIAIIELNRPEEIALVEYIRSKKPTLPILVLVPSTNWELIGKALLVGATHFTSKPVKLTEFSSAIQKTLLISRKEKIDLLSFELFRVKTLSLSNKIKEMSTTFGEKEKQIRNELLNKGNFQAKLLSSVLFGRIVSSVVHYTTNMLTSLLGHYELISYLRRMEKPERVAAELEKLDNIMTTIRENMRQIQEFIHYSTTALPSVFNITGLLDEIASELKTKLGFHADITLNFKDREKLNVFGVYKELKSSIMRIAERILEQSLFNSKFTITAYKEHSKTIVKLDLAHEEIRKKEIEDKMKSFPRNKLSKRWLELLEAYGVIHKHGGRIFFDGENGLFTMIIIFPVISQDELIFPDYSVLVCAKESPVKDYIVDFLISDGFNATGISSLNEAKKAFKNNIFSIFLYYTGEKSISKDELLKLSKIKEKTPILVIAPLVNKKPEPVDIFINGPLSPHQVSAIIRSFLYFFLGQEKVRKSI